MPLASGADLPPAQEARLAAREQAVVRLGQLVEHIYAAPDLHLSVPPMPGDDDPVDGLAKDPQVRELIGRGDLIGAIKRYREVTGAGLAEAKDAVKAMRR